jgi:hypothetical protein
VFILVSVLFALHLRGFVGGPDVAPSEAHFHWPPRAAALSSERAKSPKQIKNMNTTNQNNNVTAYAELGISDVMPRSE